MVYFARDLSNLHVHLPKDGRHRFSRSGVLLSLNSERKTRVVFTQCMALVSRSA
jgi:hypothetical protein